MSQSQEMRQWHRYETQTLAQGEHQAQVVMQAQAQYKRIRDLNDSDSSEGQSQ